MKNSSIDIEDKLPDAEETVLFIGISNQVKRGKLKHTPNGPVIVTKYGVQKTLDMVQLVSDIED